MEVKPYKIVLLFLFTTMLAACGGGGGETVNCTVKDGITSCLSLVRNQLSNTVNGITTRGFTITGLILHTIIRKVNGDAFMKMAVLKLTPNFNRLTHLNDVFRS